MKPGRDTIILSFKLASGDFSSELHMPLPLTVKEHNRAVERWLDFMSTGLRLNAERMDATFTPAIAAVAPEQEEAGE